MRSSLYLAVIAITFLTSCSIQKKIGKSADEIVLNDPAFQTAHTGISIYEPSTGKYWFDYQGDKYFVPASNTKIPTCYVAMKYLGDSLVGLKYEFEGDHLHIESTGDPTFLQAEFKAQRVFDFLKANSSKLILLYNPNPPNALGSGWSWNDYSENYMVERSGMPIYGNLIRVRKSNRTYELSSDATPSFGVETTPSFFKKQITSEGLGWTRQTGFGAKRSFTSNQIILTPTSNNVYEEIPFMTKEKGLIESLLSDTTGSIVINTLNDEFSNPKKLYSQKTDSMLKPMMHRSDNFYAEQTLLMASKEFLGVINESRIIDTVLKTDFKDLPQKPRWVDGSGLSRYNLFSPRDFIFILNKMKNEFGMERIREIFPTGGEGTISSYYKADSGYLFAKTGTLSGVVALSGYMTTKDNKFLIFSVLVNNHQSSATTIRRAVEKLLQSIRENY